MASWLPYISDFLSADPLRMVVLGALIGALRDAYPSLGAERIVGHSDIAPGRKTDPGQHFDWARLRRLVSAHAHA